MSVYVPTTTVRIERGEQLDSFGDPVDLPLVHSTGQPVAITEQRQRRFNPAEQRTTLVEEYRIRFRPGVGVREEDRLVDERTGVVYQVKDVHHPPAVGGKADVRVRAVKVGAVSVP